ncbi:hypothetical protein RYZ26_01600 [Terasakiella sp. A23]|uniref:hypothetical protein n=1 Tax=Terasakiella sp. FCG-A23 TaxID=3080561 RepID=UPI002955AD9B|nr:hypothetical protein [Terasakiella sp. A23]MDV7338271.1 hypothetical protein [Terasakiella sp. A23]
MLRSILIIFLTSLTLFSTNNSQAQEAKKKPFLYEVYVQDNTWFEVTGKILDAEAFGELFRRTTWNNKQGDYYLRFHCKFSGYTAFKIKTLKDWIHAKYVKGDENHPNCRTISKNEKRITYRDKIQKQMIERTVNNAEQKLVGSWRGEKTNSEGKTQYSWEMIRRNNGTYQSKFFKPKKDGTKKLVQETEGFWWLEDGIFHEVQNTDVLLPDIYNISIDKNSIHFDAKFKDYKFTDTKL